MEAHVITMEAENRRLMAENAALRSEIISLHLQMASQRQAPAAVIHGDLIIGNNNKSIIGNNIVGNNSNAAVFTPELINALFAQLEEKDRQFRKLLSAMSADLIKKTLNTNEE